MKRRWVAVPMILVWSLVFTVVTAIAASWPHTRGVAVTRSGYWFDPSSGSWRATGALVNAHEGADSSELHLGMNPAGQAILSGGHTLKGDSAPPEVFDPDHATWSVWRGALPPEPAAVVLPAPPDAHSSVVSCGPGCALGLPSGDAPRGDDPLRRPVFLHNGSWRPFGSVAQAFAGAAGATLTDGRIVILGDAAPFTAEGVGESTPMALVTPRESPAWTALPAPATADLARLLPLSDGSLLSFSGYGSATAQRLRAGGAAWEPAGLQSDDDSDALTRLKPLSQGRAVTFVVRNETRIDVRNLAAKIALSALSLFLLLGGILGLRRLKPGAAPIVVGVLVSAVIQGLLLFGITLLALSGAHGRPLRVHGRALRARARMKGEAPTGPVPEVNELGWRDRSWLAVAWMNDALLECVSVPAFHKLAATLRALGAAESLAARAEIAEAEEAVHTRECLSLASAYSGLALSAEAPRFDCNLDVADRTAALTELALESLEDGCLGEGHAAASARRALEDTTDSAVRGVLLRIARDEASHAELAWDVLEFCLRAGGAPVRRAVELKLRALVGSEGAMGPRSGARTVLRQRHGRFHEPAPGALWRATLVNLSARFDQIE